MGHGGGLGPDLLGPQIALDNFGLRSEDAPRMKPHSSISLRPELSGNAHRLGRFERLALLLGLLSCLFSLQLGSLHGLLEPHTYCEVHEQLEHRELGVEDAAHGMRHGRSSPIAEALAGHIPESLDHRQLQTDAPVLNPDDSEAHHACELTLLISRQVHHLPLADASLAQLQESHSLSFYSFFDTPRRVSLLRLAPKNSPPQA